MTVQDPRDIDLTPAAALIAKHVVEQPNGGPQLHWDGLPEVVKESFTNTALVLVNSLTVQGWMIAKADDVDGLLAEYKQLKMQHKFALQELTDLRGDQ